MIMGPQYETYPYDYSWHYFDALGVQGDSPAGSPLTMSRTTSVQANVLSSATGNPKYPTREAYKAAMAARLGGR